VVVVVVAAAAAVVAAVVVVVAVLMVVVVVGGGGFSTANCTTHLSSLHSLCVPRLAVRLAATVEELTEWGRASVHVCVWL
jgi:hypothetical protein